MECDYKWSIVLATQAVRQPGIIDCHEVGHIESTIVVFNVAETASLDQIVVTK